MKLKEFIEVVDEETLFKVREVEKGKDFIFQGRFHTIPYREIKNYLENEVVSIVYTQSNGIVVLIDKEKSPQG